MAKQTRSQRRAGPSNRAKRNASFAAASSENDLIARYMEDLGAYGPSQPTAYTGHPTRMGPARANRYAGIMESEDLRVMELGETGRNAQTDRLFSNLEKNRSASGASGFGKLDSIIEARKNNMNNPGLAAEMSGQYAVSPGGGRRASATHAAVSASSTATSSASYGPMHGPKQEFTGRGAYTRNFRPRGPDPKKVGKLRRGYQMATSGPGKVAIGAGLAVGALAMADSALGRDPFADAGSVVGGVQRFGDAMHKAQGPSYGNSQFQQSTQGLVFGLHNARTA